MRKLAIVIFVCFLCCCTPVAPAPPSDDPAKNDWSATLPWVFDSSVIPEIHLTVSSDEWERLLSAYDQNNNTKVFVKCDAVFIKDGESIRIPSAGLRLRGNTSRRRPQSKSGRMQHCHFRLDFHQFEKNPYHTLKGLHSVDLKWFKEDPSYVREPFCFEVFRRFGIWTAVNDIYTRLWVKVGDGKEQYLGVYGMLEHISQDYLYARREQFSDAGGYLWKCSYGARLRSSDKDFGIDDNEREHVYELKTNKDSFEDAKKQLKDFISRLEETPSESYFKWLESCIDIDLFLRTYAVNVAVGMWDDYWNNSNNYYLYFTPGGRMYFIPFDYDNTLGTSHNCGVQGDAGRQDPYHWGSSSNPLVVKILQNAEWKRLYKQYLNELCSGNGLCSPGTAMERIKEMQAAVNEYVANDTGEDMSISDKPASWGNHPEYRLLTPGKNNYFEVKAGVVAAMD